MEDSTKATIIRLLFATGLDHRFVHEVFHIEDDDETDTSDHLDLLDDNLDMVYDDDVAYEPIEEESYASDEEEED